MTRKSPQYPEKNRINLVIREKNLTSPMHILPVFIVVLLLIAAFSKFCVIDRLGGVNEKQRQIDAYKTQNQTLSAALAEYDKVLAEYGLYSAGWMTDDEKNLTDRMGALALIRDIMMPVSRVESYSLVTNTLSVNLYAPSLEALSDLVQTLEAQKLVGGVSVFTASTKEDAGQSVKTVVTITLTTQQEGSVG